MHDEWRGALVWRVLDPNVPSLEEGWASWQAVRGESWSWPGSASGERAMLVHQQLDGAFCKMSGGNDEEVAARLAVAEEQWSALMQERKETIFFGMLLVRRAA